MDCWILIGRLGFPDIWACSKFRSQQLIRLILLSSRLVYAFFSMPKGLIKGDMYINTSFCEQTWLFFGWIVVQLADWGSHIFGDVLFFDLSSYFCYPPGWFMHAFFNAKRTYHSTMFLKKL